MDLSDPGTIKGALTTTTLGMIRALDAERITFADEEGRVMLLGLLMTTLEVVMDGRLKSSTRRASAH